MLFLRGAKPPYDPPYRRDLKGTWGPLIKLNGFFIYCIIQIQYLTKIQYNGCVTSVYEILYITKKKE